MLETRNWDDLPYHVSTSKIMRQQAESALEQGQRIDLSHSVLTSLSSDKANKRPLCPVTHSKAIETVCPIDHSNVNNLDKRDLSVPSSIPSDEIDYLKFADDVDAWLLSNEDT